MGSGGGGGTWMVEGHRWEGEWAGQVVVGAPVRAFGKVKMLSGTWQVLVNVCSMCLVSWSLFFHYTGSSLSSPTLQDDSFQKQFRLPTPLCAHPVHLEPTPFSSGIFDTPVPSSAPDRGQIFTHDPKAYSHMLLSMVIKP